MMLMPNRSDARTTRAVVSSMPRSALGFLTSSELTTRLLTMVTWSERISFLHDHPTLAHLAIADRCEAEGGEQLARFVRRAATVGLEMATVELRELEALEVATRSTAVTPVPVLERTALTITNGATWLLPDLLEAAASVSHQRPELSPEIRRIVIPPLAQVAGTTTDVVHELLALASMEWEDVYPLLDSITSTDDLTDAFPATLAAARLSADVPHLGTWVSDLQGLVDAAATRGAEAAQDEHELRNLAQLLARGEGLDQFEDPAAVCSQLTGEIAVLVQQSGATWMIRAAVDVARMAVQLTGPDAPLRAGRMSNLSAIIAEGVQAGVCPPDSVGEALRAAREAHDLGSPDPSTQARLASTLGNRLSQAVDVGLCDPAELLTAVELHQEAWDLTSTDDPARAQRASNLGALLSTAVEAGLLPASDLMRALQLQDQAVSAAEPDKADLPWLLSNRANRIAQAVRLSVLQPESLLEGIEDLKRAMAMLNPAHPRYPGIASNLSSLLSEAIHAGHLPASRFPESIALAAEALNLTPKSSPDWPSYANNLASRLGVGVLTGFETSDRLNRAVDLAQQALDATPVNHPARAGRMANLIGRTLAAIEAGTAAPDQVSRVLGDAESLWLAIPATHPLRAKLANEMAVILSESVKYEIIEPARLTDAIEIAREGLLLIQPDHPDWAESASNLGVILSEAIHHSVVPASLLSEAVDLTRAAFERAADAPARAGLATNASALIAEAVVADMLDPERIREAFTLQQEALELVPFPHPDRPAYAANMIQRVADALAQSLISTDEALAHVNRLVAEAWEQATVSVTPVQRRRVLALSGRLVRYAPLLLMHITHDPAEAALAIELLRGHLLRGMRAPRLTPGLVSSDCEAGYASAAAGYDLTQLHVMDGVATHDHSLAAFRALLDATALVQTENPNAVPGLRPSREDLLDGIPEGVAVIYLVAGADTALSHYPGRAIIAGHGTCSSLLLPEMTHQAVTENVARVLDPSQSIDDVCSWLWSAAIQPLLASAAPGGGPLGAHTWAFIPTGLIGMLPLHAAASATETLDDLRRVVTIRSALSTEARRATLPLAQHPPVAMALVADDLIFPAADMAVARTLITGCSVLDPNTGPADLLAALSDASALLVSGHALHALDVGGSLRLGPPGTDLWLTGDDIARLPVRRREQAILAACSSGQTALSLPEESIGLPTALLAIGFNSVISTLWPVRDSVAFVTISRFLQLRSTSPAANDKLLLQATRQWLRRATCAELLIWLDGLEDAVALDPDATGALRREWEDYPDLVEPVPYADPRDWAAFFCTGADAPSLE